jgi:hypothetical protein
VPEELRGAIFRADAARFAFRNLSVAFSSLGERPVPSRRNTAQFSVAMHKII